MHARKNACLPELPNVTGIVGPYLFLVEEHKQFKETNACILKAYSHRHSTSKGTFCVSATQSTLSVHSFSMSEKLHLHSDHSQTALTLEIKVDFDWSLSVGHTSLEPLSHKVVIINMANLWLERLQQFDNLQSNYRKKNKNHNFKYEMYDEKQFRSRFILTKDRFREMFDIIEGYISAHNKRGDQIPAEKRLWLTLRCYTTGMSQEACANLCDTSQPSASRAISCVSEAIARLKICKIQFPTVEMFQRTKFEFWRICAFHNVVGTIDGYAYKNFMPRR